MEESRIYSLPKLPHDYAALAPYISEKQLKIHHQKHHQAYVNAANALFEKPDEARKDTADLDMKAALKELSFHIGGFRLHTLFWENLASAGKHGGSAPAGDLAKAIDAEFLTVSGPNEEGNVLVLRGPFISDAYSVESWGPMETTDDFVKKALAQILVDRTAASQRTEEGCGTGCS